LADVEFLAAFHACFGGHDDELNFVDFDVAHQGTDMLRKTTVRRAGVVQQTSDMTAIRRV
jgi:hypothetical protein